MASQPKKDARQIQPLDWRKMAKSSALIGMTSFLDIKPEDARRGYYPEVLQGRPIDVLSIDETKSPVDSELVGDSEYALVTELPLDNLSIEDKEPISIKDDDKEWGDDKKSSSVSESSTDIKTPLDILSTGSMRRTKRMVWGHVPTRNRKIIPCRLAQDGHTISEESVYKTLWDRTSPEDRTIRMGYSEISEKTRLSTRTIARIMPILREKLSIDLIEEHHSGDLIPKLYRVFSYKEILDHRRARGLEYVIRGTNVIFVSAQGDIIDLNKVTTPPVVKKTIPDKMSTGDGKSIVDFQSIAEALNRFWTIDEPAVQKLIQDCLAIRPDATTDEIRYFVNEKIDLVRSSKTIHSPTGFVLSTVPQCFAGKTFEIFRSRRAEALRLAAEEEERKRREMEAMDAWIRKTAQETIANPKASEASRKQAESILREMSS